MLKKLSQTGDTIAEVLIALAVLSLMMSASFTMANRSSQATRQALERSEASKYAQSQLELLKNYLAQGGDVSSAFFCMQDGGGSVEITDTTITSNIDTRYNDLKNDCGHGPDNRYVTIVEKKINPSNSYEDNKYIVYTRWDSVSGRGTDMINTVHRVYKDSSILAPPGGSTGAFNVSEPAPTPTGSTLFSEDFESGNLNKWALNQSCKLSSGDTIDGVSIVNAPVRSGLKSAKFTLRDEDKTCKDVPATGNPRVQLVGPFGMFSKGIEYYVSFSTYFPTGFPIINSGFFQIAEVYGAPYGGSPTIGIDLEKNDAGNANSIILRRHYKDSTGTEQWGYPAIWKSQPIVLDTWQDIVLHFKLSDVPSEGFVEIWHNGVKQTFSDGTQRLVYATLYPGVSWVAPDGKNQFYLNQYRSAIPSLGTVTIYRDDVKIWQ